MYVNATCTCTVMLLHEKREIAVKHKRRPIETQYVACRPPGRNRSLVITIAQISSMRCQGNSQLHKQFANTGLINVSATVRVHMSYQTATTNTYRRTPPGTVCTVEPHPVRYVP